MPHAMRAAVLVGLAVIVAGVSNQLNPLGIPWRLPASGRSGIPRVYEARLPEVKAARARELLHQSGVVFLDSRDEKDYKIDHAPGAVNLPMRDWERAWPTMRDKLPRERTYLLYCYGAKCGLSTRQAKQMLALGYTHLIILEHGWAEWTKAGYETVLYPKGQGKKS